MQSQGIWSTLWRKYADYKYNKFERFAVWEMIEPYRRPKTFTALITIYVAAFYTGVIGAAVTEQLYKVSFASVIDSRVRNGIKLKPFLGVDRDYGIKLKPFLHCLM